MIARPVGQHPDVRLKIHEHEPIEADACSRMTRSTSSLIYDYDLAPARDPRWPSAAVVVRLGSRRPGRDGRRCATHRGCSTVTGVGWIVNSRNVADEQVVHLLASLAGFEPRSPTAPTASSSSGPDRAGLGVGLLPLDQPTHPDVAVLALHNPTLTLRAYAATRRGRAEWAPLAVVLESLQR